MGWSERQLKWIRERLAEKLFDWTLDARRPWPVFATRHYVDGEGLRTYSSNTWRPDREIHQAFLCLEALRGKGYMWGLSGRPPGWPGAGRFGQYTLSIYFTHDENSRWTQESNDPLPEMIVAALVSVLKLKVPTGTEMDDADTQS